MKTRSLLVLTALLSACSSEDPDHPPDDTHAGPLYALMSQVYGTEGDRTVYLVLTDTLDPSAISLDGAREFSGVTNFAAVGGRILISEGEAPVITEYEIGEDHSWTPGNSVSFAAYPLLDNANFYYQFIVDEHTAYLPFDGSKRIVWDPTTMEILRVMEDSRLVFEKDALVLEAGGNRNGIEYDGPVRQAFFWHDEDWYEFGTESVVAIYDPETHEETSTISIPCPGLAIATEDEDGNTYFGSWDYSPGRALYGDAPAPCVARLRPDLTLDADWTTDLTKWTNGHYAMNFRYVGGGRALANVLLDETLGADFSGPVDQDLIANLWNTGPHWQLWLFDLENDRAQPVEGIDVDIGSGAQFAVIDERTFIFLPFDEWRRTKVYELDANGRATEHFEITGDVFKWVRVR